METFEAFGSTYYITTEQYGREGTDRAFRAYAWDNPQAKGAVKRSHAGTTAQGAINALKAAFRRDEAEDAYREALAESRRYFSVI